MGTYDHQKLLSDWRNGRITNDMATGHLLQHLSMLYQAQDEAAQKRRTKHQALNRMLTTLTQENQQLRARVDQLSAQVDGLIGLNVAVYQLKNDVDSLKQRLDQDPPA